MTKNKETPEKNAEEYIDMLKRLQADFENYMKRVEQEKKEFVHYSNHKLIEKLLTIVDGFEIGLDVMEKNDGEVDEGLRMIYKQLLKVLDEEGVRPIQSVGEKLDPFKHDVVDIITGEKEAVIIKELQKGYMLKDKVLRAAKVQISKVEEKK